MCDNSGAKYVGEEVMEENFLDSDIEATGNNEEEAYNNNKNNNNNKKRNDNNDNNNNKNNNKKLSWCRESFLYNPTKNFQHHLN